MLTDPIPNGPVVTVAVVVVGPVIWKLNVNGLQGNSPVQPMSTDLVIVIVLVAHVSGSRQGQSSSGAHATPDVAPF